VVHHDLEKNSKTSNSKTSSKLNKTRRAMSIEISASLRPSSSGFLTNF